MSTSYYIVFFDFGDFLILSVKSNATTMKAVTTIRILAATTPAITPMVAEGEKSLAEGDKSLAEGDMSLGPKYTSSPTVTGDSVPT